MSSENKKIYLSPPHMNGEEIAFVTDAIQSNWVAPLGPHVDAFESEMADYIGVSHAAALSSGTAALHLSLKILGIKRGDIVFCSDLTFVASANPIKYLGAIPVFIDSDETSWNMCPKSLEMAFKTHEPKAVIVTDIYGQCADYDSIKDICDRYSTPIIEDAAESLGASYKKQKCGSFGEMAILSFNGNKIITTSGGGMLLSDNLQYIDMARKLATQAREPAIHYEHKELGYNYRMSNIIAAIGRAQLKTIDTYVEKRRHIFNKYEAELGTIDNIGFMPEIENGRSTRWLSIMILNMVSREKIDVIINKLSMEKIEARPVWKPMHLQPLYRKNEYFSLNNKFSVSEKLFNYGLCLPSGSNLKTEDQARVILNIKSYFLD
ncbi:MAG: pyridoxal phosphate-dependent aminotransferase [Candidatus Marinimicrobia bacterium]|jgi:pyridoxal phosphate-dependent aminotransferase EpsN|nr:pyridoxal phosphate-dependent aminotransferase [Candidatus Neomarinimicrobiota bacterium]MBT5069630.1 pyridoxal phosphate-dependent aminotransferase [Candidatus Neomarinimicrobiota bacterium]MBT5758441.1 pyridoxal phosphate-dependent aminotransferase [Candidatus Neomarinimicrobiota bacterium]MBT6469639.1 pyridoxal phosphate-dependent aminotransferase [Candidatus Neomarinimicrobiota bacterium]MBT6936011.1 pyridoxal phosphate-dependent aminotransferase [Candidatus Neomarinimicrobiota bacterium